MASLPLHRPWRLATLSAATLLALVACGGGDDDASDAKYASEIRRTTYGIPHIKANDWGGLGYGFGYAQAQDNLCTMADGFVTYRGERSRHFGGDALSTNRGTIGQPVNLASDFFHKHVITEQAIRDMQAAQPEDMQTLSAGFVAGYNRYVREIKNGKAQGHAACRNEAWVAEISTDDLYRRLYSTNLAAGYSNFLAQIASATAPAVNASASTGAASATARSANANANANASGEIAPIALEVGGTAGVGSNMYGFGSDATDGAPSILFGNPHWYWRGMDRFYQAQLTIPNKMDVSGVSFLGVPLILIGFNENVAWSHTVSTARRFGFFQLTLDPASPTRYLRDGQSVPMQAHEITVDVRDASGNISPVKRTLYTSEYGPLVNLGAMHPALAWNQQTAFAIRDINAENFRTFRNWMRWAQSPSLENFIQVQKEEAAIPWVNTVAVGKNRAEAWYADIGAVPNVSPQQVQSCTTQAGQLLAGALPRVPILDGSRSECDWQTAPDAVQPGALPASQMPSLLRRDYVANMNDSYWLTNPAQPLTGFPAIMGAVNDEQSFRTRLGHIMVADRLAGTDGYAGNHASVPSVLEMVLDSRVLTAEVFKDEVLALACGSGVGLTQACGVLQAWDNRGNTDSRGAMLWDAFWSRFTASGQPAPYAVPFDAQNPLYTPRGIQPQMAGRATQALREAANAITSAGIALDAPLGSYLYASNSTERFPLYGGCGQYGYFTIACPDTPISSGSLTMDGQAHGNTYLQVVHFPTTGVQAHTFLTYSLSDDPASPHYRDYTAAYSQKQWHEVPYTESQIMGNRDLKVTQIRE